MLQALNFENRNPTIYGQTHKLHKKFISEIISNAALYKSNGLNATELMLIHGMVRGFAPTDTPIDKNKKYYVTFVIK